MLKNYALVFFDRRRDEWRYIFGLTKKECNRRIKCFDLGNDCISELHIVRVVDAWSSYDGLFMKGGKLCETNSIH